MTSTDTPRKIIYIIPGFQHDVLSSEYRAIADIFVHCGFEVVPLSIAWDATVLSDWVDGVRPQILTDPDAEQYIFGFSFGAMVAAMIAAEVHLHGLILASLSPYFFEHLVDIPDDWNKDLSQYQLADFAKFTFTDITTKINCSTWILLGDEEARVYPLLAQQSEDARRQIRDSQLIKVPNGRHDIGQREYLDIILQVAHLLSD